MASRIDWARVAALWKASGRTPGTVAAYTVKFSYLLPSRMPKQSKIQQIVIALASMDGAADQDALASPLYRRFAGSSRVNNLRRTALAHPEYVSLSGPEERTFTLTPLGEGLARMRSLADAKWATEVAD